VNIGGPASGPCNGFSGGLGVSGPGFSVGANTSTVDKGCEMRETARVAAMLGRMDVANAVLENIAIVQDALKARTSREKKGEQPTAAAAANVSAADKQSDRQQMAAQAKAGQEALKRQSTMAAVYNTIRYSTAATQSDAKSDQVKMAEEAMARLEEAQKVAAREAAARAEGMRTATSQPDQQPAVVPASTPAIQANPATSPRADMSSADVPAPAQMAMQNSTDTKPMLSSKWGDQQQGQTLSPAGGLSDPAGATSATSSSSPSSGAAPVAK